MTLRILGYEYTVTLDSDMDSMGSQRSYSLHIRIGSQLCQQQLVSTLLHEIIEALNSHLQLELSHHAIMGLESGLFQVLKDGGVDLTPLLKELGQAGRPRSETRESK